MTWEIAGDPTNENSSALFYIRNDAVFDKVRLMEIFHERPSVNVSLNVPDGTDYQRFLLDGYANKNYYIGVMYNVKTKLMVLANEGKDGSGNNILNVWGGYYYTDYIRNKIKNPNISWQDIVDPHYIWMVMRTRY